MRVSWFIAAILAATVSAALGQPVAPTHYAHRAWTRRDGAFTGRPQAVAQTTDGYLWIGTDAGLFRFDGVRFLDWRASDNSALPDTNVVKLLATQDGSLWVGTRSGLARIVNNRLTAYLKGSAISALLEDNHAVLWVGTHGGVDGLGQLCSIRNGLTTCEGADGSLGRFVISLHQDSTNALWIGAATGLWQWMPVKKVFSVAHRFPEVHSISHLNDILLVSVNRQLRQLLGNALSPFRLQGVSDSFVPTLLRRDRSGAIWIGSQGSGVLRLHRGRTQAFSESDGLSSNIVVDVIEDRERNIWVVTVNGIDQITELAAATLTTKHGLSSGTVTAIHRSHDNGLWIGTARGLQLWTKDGFHKVRSPAWASANIASLFEDSRHGLWVATIGGVSYWHEGRWTRATGVGDGFFRAFAEDRSGNIWIAEQERGLYVVRNGLGAHVAQRTLRDHTIQALVADPLQGIWMGFAQGGIAHLTGGQIGSTYSVDDGLSHGDVRDLRFDRQGTLWVATSSGLSRINNHVVTTLTEVNGLPCSGVRWIIEDNSEALWLRLDCGLVRFTRPEIDAWASTPSRRVSLSPFDSASGVVSPVSTSGYTPNVTKTLDGRLWFRSHDGVSVVNPATVRTNDIAPIVHVESVTADQRSYTASEVSTLPPHVRTLSIDYTATSLTAPARVRFKYILDGYDKTWVDAGARRQAFYNDLPPGAYRFKVVAANDAGLWTEEAASWEFTVEPALYQTAAFRAAAVVIATFGIWLAHRWRVHRLASLMNLRFEERLSERNRIAQGLHDTVLQGLVSLSLQLHVMMEETADSPNRGKLAHIIRRIGDVAEEGRRVVNALHVAPSGELTTALVREAERLRGSHPVEIGLTAIGRRRALNPLIRDSVYLIAREALANALQHSHATHIRIRLTYGADAFVVAICDNGVGVDLTVLGVGNRVGHFGLPGMRERAEQVGAEVHLRSGQSAGTEVEICVPNAIAFNLEWRRERTTGAEAMPS